MSDLAYDPIGRPGDPYNLKRRERDNTNADTHDAEAGRPVTMRQMTPRAIEIRAVRLAEAEREHGPQVWGWSLDPIKRSLINVLAQMEADGETA